MKWLLMLMAAGCVGQGTGQVQGDVHVKQCNDRQDFDAPNYVMNPDFFVGEPIEDINQNAFPENRLEIRVQASPGNIGGVVTSLDQGAGIDTLMVSISDVRAVGALLGQPIPLIAIIPTLPAPMPPPPVRVDLRMLGTCPFSPNNTLSADTPSTITFTKFGNAVAGQEPPPDFKVDFGDTITATFDLTLVDERFKLGLTAVPMNNGHVTGNFTFELRRGAAGQTFP